MRSEAGRDKVTRSVIIWVLVAFMLSVVIPYTHGGSSARADGEPTLNFTEPRNVSGDPSLTDGNQQMAVSPETGSTHLVWVKTGAQEIYYTDNLNLEFSPIDLSGNPGLYDGEPAIAVDRLGRAHVAWRSEITAGNEKIRYVRVENGAVSHSEVIDSSYPHRDFNPDIAVDPEGNAHIAFNRDTGSYFNIFYSDNCSGSFSVPVNISKRNYFVLPLPGMPETSSMSSIFPLERLRCVR